MSMPLCSKVFLIAVGHCGEDCFKTISELVSAGGIVEKKKRRITLNTDSPLGQYY